MKLRWMVLLLAVVIALPALAHGDKKHVVGTIEKVDGASLTVKTADGKLVVVKLATATVYVDNTGKAAKAASLAVGQRVVIHATPKGTDLIADEVRFTPSSAAAAKAAA